MRAGGSGAGKKEPEIIVIPEKYYGMALKMKAPDMAEEKPALPPPPPPKPKPAPVIAPLPKHSVLPIVIVVIAILLVVGGGFVYFNRELLFKKPTLPPPPAPVVAPMPPTAPSNLSATISGQSVSLAWDDNASGELGYQVERKEGTGTFLQLTNLSPNSRAFLDMSVQTGKTYAYRVLAINDAGPSAPSNEATASVAAATPPAPLTPSLPPTGLDSDSDGISDVEEPLYGTDPRNPDSDRDGFLDGNEVFHLYNPAAKAPVRLLDSGLVKPFSAPAGWSMYVPNAWTDLLDRPDGSQATITTGHGETFQIKIQDNSQHVPLLEWYLTGHPGVVSSDVRSITTKGGLEGIASPDRLEAFFAWDGKVFAFRYLMNTEPFINFRTTYEMMLNSLKLTGAPVVSVSEDTTNGPGTLLGAVPTSTATSTQP